MCYEGNIEIIVLFQSSLSSEHVREVYAGDNGIFSAVQSGSLLIDCSTIDGADAIEMSDLAKEKGAQYLDAPVSGGRAKSMQSVKVFLIKKGTHVIGGYQVTNVNIKFE